MDNIRQLFYLWIMEHWADTVRSNPACIKHQLGVVFEPICRPLDFSSRTGTFGHAH